MTKVELLQNSSCDKTQKVTKLKLWQKLGCDISDSSDSSDQKKLFSIKLFFSTLLFTIFSLLFYQTRISSKNSNLICDETQKLKLGWNSKTQIVIKLEKLKLCWNLKSDETQKLKWWQNKQNSNYNDWTYDL